MPLIDEHTRATDRRPPNKSAWLVVMGAAALLWVVVAFLVSFVPRILNPPGTRTAAQVAVQAYSTQMIVQAQQLTNYGDWKQAAATLQSLGPNPALGIEDKHTYLRLLGESYRKSGSPVKGAAYYDRFLTMGLRVASQECQKCHNPGGISPEKPSDLLTSKLGANYAACLQDANRLTLTRDSLAARLKKHPEEAGRLHLLLFHIETARGDKKAAATHATKMQALDKPAQ